LGLGKDFVVDPEEATSQKHERGDKLGKRGNHCVVANDITLVFLIFYRHLAGITKMSFKGISTRSVLVELRPHFYEEEIQNL
jgi:hypothetical protein